MSIEMERFTPYKFQREATNLTATLSLAELQASIKMFGNISPSLHFS
jgi:hypothetical protein